METRSSGYHYWTTYEAEGDKARVIAHYSREQKDLAIAPHTEFDLNVFGLGGGLTIGVRATTLRLSPSVMASIDHSAPETPPRLIAGPPAQRIAAAINNHHRRVLTSPVMEGSAGRLDGGLFDPWDNPLPDWLDPDPFPPLPPDPPVPPGGGGGSFHHTSVRVELHAPGVAEPVQIWELPEEFAGTVRTLTFQPPQGFPTPDAPVRRIGWWRVTVTPTSGEPAMVYVESSAVQARVPFRTQAISKRLFDHLFRVSLEALVPRVFVEGTKLRVGIGKEIASEFGVPQIISESDISPAVSWAELKSLNITAESGRTLKQIANSRNRHPIYLTRVQDNDIVIRIQAAFSNGSVTAYGFDVGKLNGEFGEIFLALSRDLSQLSPVAYLNVDFSSLADWLIDIASLFTEVDHDIVNTKVEELIVRYEVLIRSYLRELLSRTMGQRSVVHEVSFGGNAWQVKYFDDPPIPNPDTPWRHWVDDFGGRVGGVGGLVDPFELEVIDPLNDSGTSGTMGDDDDNSPSPSNEPSPQPNDPVGVFPDRFANVDDRVSIERLDRHQCLVFIMMENRSFDHLLGGLMTARPRANADENYEGPPSNATNAPCGGFRQGVPLVRVERIAMGTKIPVDPRHYTRPTRFQMHDGTEPDVDPNHPNYDVPPSGDMKGFARDVFNNRTDSPQIAMTMYGEQHLPTYYKLADDFCVADRWFCAHPGPTWPNRYAMLLGEIPLLDNHEIRDPEIGFLKHYSIFDALTSYGIEWKVFESDFSLIRTFDRYRLDDRRVVPLFDREDGLEATLRGPGALPRVIFIEPNFADLPPLATANDDHPPCDLAMGQKFIAEMCDLIWRYRFDECLVCITYDEHGGLYDHVAPPGTPKGDPAFLGQIPKLHTKGPTYLGPRVPTFILSPYVSAGSVDHTVYDHTSILKTILVHNRQRFPQSLMGSFGERVNWAAHLGQALTLSTPRQHPQHFDTQRWRTPGNSRFDDVAVSDDLLVTDGSLDNIAVVNPPNTPRTITFFPNDGSAIRQHDEPDFHAALRDALKPRT